MYPRLNHVLNLLIGSFIGVWIGHSLYLLWDYHAHPGLYALRSAPWYTGILVNGLCTAGFLAVALLVKYILHRKGRSVSREK